MSEIALSLAGVVKEFGERRALDGVDLELHRGEVLGLLGPNGAGKSTIVRTVMGRVSPDQGRLFVFGKEISPSDHSLRREIGFVPQEIALYPLLTVRENAEVIGRYQGLSGMQLGSKVDQALEWAALTDRARDVTKNLSGGMKRRLNMAVGILHDPRVLLLDEPTVGVDPQSREKVYEMIESLRGGGVSILYTTHYMEEAERLCDRIAIIDHGRIVASGTRSELVGATIGSKSDFVIDCAAEPPAEIAAALRERGVQIDGSKLTLSGCREPAEMLGLVQSLERDSVEIVDFALRTPSLQDVFLHLTGKELRE
ncbi:MAG: ABC transporter ATP-binding protein [Thermoanaerobaculia bacterium]